MALTALPTPPSTSDPANFDTRADAFLAALQDMVTEINSGAIDLAGGTLTSILGIVAGAVGAPGLFFSGDTDTGIYSPGANQWAVTAGGVQRLLVNGSAIALTAAVTISSTLGISGTLTGVAGTFSGALSSTNAISLTVSGSALSTIESTSNAGAAIAIFKSKTSGGSAYRWDVGAEINVGSGAFEIYDRTNNRQVLSFSGSTGGASFAYPMTITSTSAPQLTLTSGDGVADSIRFIGQSSRRNWQIGNQVNVNDAFEITPSTANGGTTFSSPAISIVGSTLSVTFGGSITAGVANFSGAVSQSIASTSRMTVASTNNGSEAAFVFSGKDSGGSANAFRLGLGITADSSAELYDTTASASVFRYVRGSAFALTPKLAVGGASLSSQNIAAFQLGQNDAAIVQVTNAHGGNSAVALFRAYSGYSFDMAVTSSTYTTNGSIVANRAYMYTDAPNGMLIAALSGPILIAPNGLTEIGRFVSSCFLMGTTTAGGWGGDAKGEFVTSTGAGISGYATSSGGQAVRSRVDSDTADLIAFYRSTSKSGSFISSGGGTPNIQWLATNTAYVISGGSGGVQLTSGATSWSPVSYRAAKDNIVGVDALTMLRSVGALARSNDEEIAVLYDIGGRREIGSIVENWIEYLPEIVSTLGDGKRGLFYDRFGPLALQCCYQLIEVTDGFAARVETNEQKIARLEARIDELEKERKVA